MEVNQIYSLMNDVTGEVLGENAPVAEDLSNVVDIGTSVFNNGAVDAYVKSLVNHIGKVIFVSRPYSGNAKSVLMDGWEYGSVLEKIRANIPEAVENESWELEDGASYDPNIFMQPSVSAKFFNKRVTFEVQQSITERQVKQSFSSPEQLNGFLSMLYNTVDRSMTIKTDALIMRTINNMIGETLHAEVPGGTYNGRSGVKAVNLLYLYNSRYDTELTAADAITDATFLKFASFYMGLYESRLSTVSRLFNIEATDKFTPSDMLHVILLADFAKAADTYLQSDTFHEQFTKLPNAEIVPYWQGSGTSYAFSDISGINIKTSSGDNIEASGILGVMFDRDALGVANIDRRVTTNYNPKAEFYNNFHKFDAGYFNDFSENFVLFYVA